MRFRRACGVAVVALSLLSCKKKVTVELPEAAPPPVAEDAAPPPADLDAAVEAAAPLATATASAKTPVVAKDTSGPFVAGDIWNGNYNCRGNSSLALHIVSSAGNRVATTFNFTGPKGDVGSFHQSGFYDPISRHLVLTAGAWIKQPAGFVPVNLDGFVDPNFHNYTGRVIGPGCSSFALRH